MISTAFPRAIRSLDVGDYRLLVERGGSQIWAGTNDGVQSRWRSATGTTGRLSWSPPLPLGVQIAALVVAAAGKLLSIWATAVNRFYGRLVRIQKERGHVVISDGPHRIVRHPGYLGQIVFSLASALALGSLWALLPGGLFALLLVVVGYSVWAIWLGRLLLTGALATGAA